ncbi:MAG: ribonuclease R [Dysgonamonadaceae bacterium]|jgi:ribonuclease R|nr:ribonuclease R [Dysgonamonadaceae bacterium]
MVKTKIKGNKSGSHLKTQELLHRIVNLFNTYPKECLNYKQVSHEIGAATHSNKLVVAELLEQLQEDDFLIEEQRGKYRLNGLGLIAEGTFERRSNGKNAFIPNDSGNPVFVAERNSMHAMNGDKVRVQMFAKRKGHEPEAEVLEILERRQQTFVGTLKVEKSFAFLIVDNKILSNDIFIPKEKLKNGKNGQKALVKILEWPEQAKNPIGKVVDILGDAGNNDTEMHAILAEFGLPYTYPEAIEKAAGKIPTLIPEQALRDREDFRGIPTFTIDPKDAKDFDDALSIRKLKDNLWEVGVHIADVTYYVKPGDVIDKEASQRATSVYLVDRTVPMLPEVLCNQLCSLRPDEDKLCFSVIFELTEAAKVVNYRIRKTIIHSNRRFAYEEAQTVLETGVGDFQNELHTLDILAKKLRKERFAAGAINFDRYEMAFDLDQAGKPVRVYFKESKDANKLIEEFMLLANKTVAQAIGKKSGLKRPKAFVYRIHDLPDPQKMENFSEFIRRFGYKLKIKGTNADISKGINRLLDDVQGKKEQNLIETVAVRAMAKAQYSTHNIGHYGLAFDYYTHFTSPIRRYPDMMVHRLLERYLSGGRTVSEDKLEEECKHSSAMENLAATAERASIKYKQVEFMADKLGMVFEGVISGVTEWGLYVEINENKCEGMVPIRDLDDDYYEFDEKNYCLIGRRNKFRYQLGDSLTIKVARANLERKQLDFMLMNKRYS